MRRGRVLQSKIENPKSKIRACLGPGALLCILLLLVAPGCTIFPQGSYWPPLAARHEPGAPLPQAQAHLFQSPAATPAEAAARRAALQAAITQRWSGEDLARSARAMNGWAGRAVYADALQTVVWFYVDPVTYRQLVVAGLESLRAAMDNADFRRRFPEAEPADKRELLIRALDALILEAYAANPVLAWQAAGWAEEAMASSRRLLGLPDGVVVAEMLFGAMDSLDPYSRYLTPEMFRVYTELFQGVYVGIGAELTSHDGRFFIKEVFAGGGAEKAGLAAGDEIVAADGKPAAGLTLPEVGRHLRGQEGTTVVVAVRTGGQGEPHDVTVERRRIHMPAVRSATLLDAEKGVAYVRLAEFQEGSAAELRRAVEGLVRRGARSLILDLRDNPGGSLFEAVDVVALFIPSGPVIRTRGRMIGATWKYDVSPFDRPAWTGPLAVLTNGDTASAAEIVASALKERGRATVVGQRTFGKGAVQITFPVDWGAAAVCLTMARVYDIKDECTDGRGVTPDREVPPAAGPPPPLAEDPVIRAARASLEAPKL